MGGIQVWSLTFVCSSCKSTLAIYIQDSPTTTRESLRDLCFELQCLHPGCTWTASKHGRETVHISPAPFVLRIDS
jgi:hypothetical protein